MTKKQEATTVIIGADLLARKDIQILHKAIALASPKHLNAVILQTKGNLWNQKGLPVLSQAHLGGGTICINLNTHLQEAANNADDNTSMMALFYVNLIRSYFHEIHHIESWNNLKAYPPAKYFAEEEKVAEKWANEMLFKIAKNEDVEPGDVTDSTFLKEALPDMLLEMMESEDNQKKAEQQAYFVENRIFWEAKPDEEDDGVTITKFCDFVELMAPEGGEWKFSTLKDAIDRGYKKMDITNVDVVENIIRVLKGKKKLEDPEDKSTNQTEDKSTNQAVTPDVVEPSETEMLEMLEMVENVQPTEPASAQPATTYLPPPAQVNQAPPAPSPTNTQNTGLDQATTAQIATGIYKKIVSHIYSIGNRVLGNDISFNNPEVVVTTPILLDEAEKSIITEMEYMTPEGRTAVKSAEDGQLLGAVTSKVKLPIYKIGLLVGGKQITRVICPQNPASRYSNGQLKTVAEQARRGAKIVWVMDGSDSVPFKDKYILKFYEGVWSHNVNGSWTEIAI